MEKIYEVKGMSCVICKNNVEKAINSINGVNNAKVNLLENEITINFNENIVDEKEFAKKLKNTGYSLLLEKEKAINKDKTFLFISIVLSIVLMFVSMKYKNESSFYQLIIASIVIVLNIDRYIKGYYSLFKLNPNMDSLVSLSSSIAYIYSLITLIKNMNNHLYFDTAAMILTIVSLGKYIEGNAKSKTVKVLRGLSTLIPMQANLIKDGKIEIIKIEELKKDDVVIVYPGESIPQDGIIIKGSSSLNESMLTGEALPIDKTVNDIVFGGTINETGTIEVKINKTGNTSALSNIINLTKQATTAKIPIESIADKFSKYFIVIVVSISIITFILWIIISNNFELSLNFALSVLVISCPCSLGLATPSAVAVAIGKCAQNGILIKNPKVLEIIGKIKNIIFDKTGTLTTEKLEIINEIILSEEYTNVIASLENSSKHPIAKTIADKYGKGSLIFDECEIIPTKGIKAKLNNDIYIAGNNLLVSIPEEYIGYAQENAYSYIGVSKNDALLGVLFFADKLRDNSINAINNLKKRGINPIMCTGDSKIAASNIAYILGIKDYLFEAKPEDKEKLINDIKTSGITAMVGDGINDAIALSSADCSFTIKSATDIASASSDVILMKNDLNDISFVYDLSNKTIRIIKQNIFWGILYNSICIPIAAGLLYKFGIVLSPIMASIAMLLSSLCVLMNALRINFTKRKD